MFLPVHRVQKNKRILKNTLKHPNHCRKGCLSLPLNNNVFAHFRNGGETLVKLKNSKLQYSTHIFFQKKSQYLQHCTAEKAVLPLLLNDNILKCKERANSD